MKDKKLLYDSLLNQHRVVSNKISEIKGRNFEPSAEDKKEIKKLEFQLVEIMNQLRVLFN